MRARPIISTRTHTPTHARTGEQVGRFKFCLPGYSRCNIYHPTHSHGRIRQIFAARKSVKVVGTSFHHFASSACDTEDWPSDALF